MKRLLVMVGLMMPLAVPGQGTVMFANYLAKSSGNRTPGVNAPIVVGSTGMGATGNDYIAELFFAPVGTTGMIFDSQEIYGGGSGWVGAVSGGSNVWRVFNSTPAGAGYLKGAQIVFDPNAGPGTQVAVQLRAWTASLGTDYESAWAAVMTGSVGGFPAMGASAVQTLVLGSPVGVQPNLGTDVDVATYGIYSATPGLGDGGITTPAFSMWEMIPEPSGLALLGLGVAGAMVYRHRTEERPVIPGEVGPGEDD